MAQQKQNQDHAKLIASGLPFRIAAQHSGRSRIYLGTAFETFFNNNCTSYNSEKKAPHAKAGTHLGGAMNRLAARLPEIISEHEEAELRRLLPRAAISQSKRI